MTSRNFPSYPRVRSFLALLLALAGLSLIGCKPDRMVRDEGINNMRQGHVAAANKQFARLVKRDPTNYLAQYYLGRSYLKMNQPLKAELTLEQALMLRPRGGRKNPQIIDLLAEAMYRDGQHDKLHNFLARVAHDSGHSRDYLRQGKYLEKTGDMDAARAAYRKAAYFAPSGDARPYLAIAHFYYALHDQPNAVKALRYAYYVDPTNTQVANGLRRAGIVPGPTIQVQPPKPKLLQ